jgi:S-DNA-T family DNA segregation ATPase FtsK/SpoIIIE
LKLSAEFIGALNDNAVRVYQDGAYVVVEVPGLVDTVQVADILRCDEFSNSSRMTVAIGKAIDGKNVLADIEDMPHMLIAGTTGSGKTVFMHGLIVSLLLKHTPSEMELYLVDPKGVEFGCYSQLCMCHMVKRVSDAVMLLNNLCDDMENRYNAIAAAGVRDIDEYNAVSPYHMKRKIVFIDELADLMLVSKGSVENSIARLAQKARACGIHLIIATQRPTVNVVTGLIKSNISVRVCFAVPSYRDSMVMLDKGGAEKLLGKGDMLYKSGTGINVVRLQGGFISRVGYTNVVFELMKNQEDCEADNNAIALNRNLTEEGKDDLQPNSPVAVKSQSTGWTTASLVLGVVGIFLSIYFIGLPLSIVGFIIGIMALCQENVKVLAVISIVCNLVGILIPTVIILAFLMW